MRKNPCARPGLANMNFTYIAQYDRKVGARLRALPDRKVGARLRALPKIVALFIHNHNTHNIHACIRRTLITLNFAVCACVRACVYAARTCVLVPPNAEQYILLVITFRCKCKCISYYMHIIWMRTCTYMYNKT